MATIKNLGIFMDHSTAHLIEFTQDPMETRTLESAFTHTTKEESLSKSENVMHNKEQHEQATYYKELSNVIKNYEEVVLFGPTEAKSELYNMLVSDHHFAKIKLRVKPTDKLTEHQQHAFVREYFSRK